MAKTRVLMCVLAFGLLAAYAFSSLFHTGFLADDYFMGWRIAKQRLAFPGFAGAVRDAFLLQWTPDFDVFRPLTILSLEADYALFGADGRRHHATNLFLWTLTSALAALLIRRLQGTKHQLATFAIFLLVFFSPVATEALGWLVAREDLFVALLALVALHVRLSFPTRPWTWAVALILPLLAKETAVVLPAIFVFFDLLLLSPMERWRVLAPLRFLRRYWMLAALLIAYFAYRFWLFEKVGGTYNGRTYVSYLDRTDLLEHLGRSLGDSAKRLFGPVNDGMAHAPFGARTVAIVFWAAFGVIFLTARTPFLWAIFALWPWVLLPLLILSVPLGGVGPEMQKSRFLLLPFLGVVLALGPAIHKSVQARKVLVLLPLGVLVLFGARTLNQNLQAYADATAIAERTTSDIARYVADGAPAVLFNIDPEGAGGGVALSLSERRGVHVLSAGIFQATLPPFVAGRGRHILPVPDGKLEQVWNAAPQDAHVLALTRSLDPEVVNVAPAALGPPPMASEPTSGSSFSLADLPPFRVTGIPDVVPASATLRVRAVNLEFYRATALLPLGKSVNFSLRDLDIEHNGAPVGRKLDSDVLRALPERRFFWWVEAEEAGQVIWRTRPSLITIQKP